MKTIKVHLGKRSYDIVIGDNIINSLGRYLKTLAVGKDAVIVTNPTVKRRWGKKLSASLRSNGFSARFEVVPDTEKSKSIETCFKLLSRVSRQGQLKQIFIIAFGGGVIGDLAGFAASIYRRGVPYVQLPTTLVAQVDSAIGGKTAIDLKTGKNLVGAFYQPRMVFSEIGFLKTLPLQQIREGLSEIIKYGVIKDPILFKFLENDLSSILRLDKKSIEFIVQRASSIKSMVVDQDEFDKTGARAILNYGHTIGHAIEAAGEYSKKYTHGNAISIGMIAANIISMEMGLFSSAGCMKIENLLRKAGLPTRVKEISQSKIYKAHLYDKKFINGNNRFVLPVRIGKVEIVEAIPEKIIKKAINLICEKGR